jgi:hypothetical protein
MREASPGTPLAMDPRYWHDGYECDFCLSPLPAALLLPPDPGRCFPATGTGPPCYRYSPPGPAPTPHGPYLNRPPAETCTRGGRLCSRPSSNNRHPETPPATNRGRWSPHAVVQIHRRSFIKHARSTALPLFQICHPGPAHLSPPESPCADLGLPGRPSPHLICLFPPGSPFQPRDIISRPPLLLSLARPQPDLSPRAIDPPPRDHFALFRLFSFSFLDFLAVAFHRSPGCWPALSFDTKHCISSTPDPRHTSQEEVIVYTLD